ncbi:hypothetical protein E2C01_068827 [Portunus trituberculatus]|uniref:Uncharacterized protein n=1 Tax=Portunus trituberculatus TaxID=210409 RepID=A0A5B7I0K0_PORTR|nr:hypothetical protein [Portunus trituberculatus]
MDATRPLEVAASERGRGVVLGSRRLCHHHLYPSRRPGTHYRGLERNRQSRTAAILVKASWLLAASAQDQQCMAIPLRRNHNNQSQQRQEDHSGPGPAVAKAVRAVVPGCIIMR